MPSELPRLPRETHTHLLTKGGNTHMRIVGYEVAEMRTNRPNWFAWCATNLLAPSTAIAFAALVFVMWAKMLTGG